MNLQRKTIYLPGKRQVYLLVPDTISDGITATDDNKGYHYILSNGNGYSLLTKFFASAITLEDNEIAYLPLQFRYKKAYEKSFPELENHCSGIVIFNYTTTQISTKDITAVLKSKPVKEEPVFRTEDFSSEFPDHWKTQRRLTVKKHGRTLIISGNKDIFTSLAQSSDRLADYGDDAQFNDFPPHMHHDWDENTAHSVGITLYYWHHGEDTTAPAMIAKPE